MGFEELNILIKLVASNQPALKVAFIFTKSRFIAILGRTEAGVGGVPVTLYALRREDSMKGAKLESK